jgi:hypothetical protein
MMLQRTESGGEVMEREGIEVLVPENENAVIDDRFMDPGAERRVASGGKIDTCDNGANSRFRGLYLDSFGPGRSGH